MTQPSEPGPSSSTDAREARDEEPSMRSSEPAHDGAASSPTVDDTSTAAGVWPPVEAAFPPPGYAPATVVTAAPLAAVPSPSTNAIVPVPAANTPPVVMQPVVTQPAAYVAPVAAPVNPVAAPQVVQVVVHNQLAPTPAYPPPYPYPPPYAYPYAPTPMPLPYAYPAPYGYSPAPVATSALTYAGAYAQPVGNAIVHNLPAGTLVRVGQRDRLTYALLALFLGFVGGHKFYTGRIGEGLFYLLFSWTGLPALVSLFEGIAAIVQSDEAFDMQHNVRAVG